MSPCNRPNCAGTVEETGFCDTCGRRPLVHTDATSTEPATGDPPPTSGLPSSRSNGTQARGGGSWASGDLLPFPVFELPDLADRVQRDPQVPEGSRYCGNPACKSPVGRSYRGQPDHTDGYCPRCGARFSFTPKLHRGDRVGDRYEVEGCLARGGLGWVYLARDTHLDNKAVALKGLVNTGDDEARKLADAERRFLTSLDHPNIVRIMNFVGHRDPVSDEETSYIVMEYVDGPSLRQIMERARAGELEPRERFRLEEVIGYGCEILAALDYLHGHGRLYCDMKPDNVIQGADRVKLIDLGAVRTIEDRDSRPVYTPGYQVDEHEIHVRGLTVRSDLFTVGKTLNAMYHATPDWSARHQAPGPGDVAFGIESFEHVVKRATDADYRRRFASAAEVSEQLRGVLREILALRDGRQRAEPSTLFEVSAALLDDGLGAVPPLARWTTTGPDWRRVVLADGRPRPAAAAVRLPAPRANADDPAADFLATVSAIDPRRLIEKLATFGTASVEVQLCGCRAHLLLADLEGAEGCLRAAAKILDDAEPYDWRMAWHRGLLALAREAVEEAEAKFTEVHRMLPGEDAPKLALGFCAETLVHSRLAERCYRAVWRRDRSQAGAAFGLARIRLSTADRAGAVKILDEVPEVSRHYDAARIAAVRVLFERLAAGPSAPLLLPTAADVSEAVRRLPLLYLDGGDRDGESRTRLSAAVREVGLDCVRRTAGHLAGDGDILGDPMTEHGLRHRLDQSFRALAGQARTADDHGVLIDLANAVRPKTWW